MTETLIAAIERLGAAVDRGAAIRELCITYGSGLDGAAASVLLDDWRNVHRRYYALAGATRDQLHALWALVEALRARDGGRRDE